MTGSPAASAADAEGPDDLLWAVPYVLGYRPTDSLVCVFLDGTGQLAVAARMDWQLAMTAPADTAAAVWEPAARSAPQQVLLVAVDACAPPAQTLAAMAAVAAEFARFPVQTIWAGELRGDAWRGLGCAGEDCPGHTLDPLRPPPMVARMVSDGRAPAPDRAAVLAEVRPPRGGRVLTPVIPPAGPGLEEWRDAAITRFLDVLAGGAPPGRDDVSWIGAACADIRVRDVVLWKLTCGPEHLTIGWQRCWDVVSQCLRRRLPRRHVAPVAAVGALVAWQLGDGTRASACLERAQRADRYHSLADLVRGCVAGGMPPSTWLQVMSSLSEEVCRHGRS